MKTLSKMQNWPNQETNGIYNHKNNNSKTKENTIQQKNEKKKHVLSQAKEMQTEERGWTIMNNIYKYY